MERGGWGVMALLNHNIRLGLHYRPLSLSNRSWICCWDPADRGGEAATLLHLPALRHCLPATGRQAAAGWHEAPSLHELAQDQISGQFFTHILNSGWLSMWGSRDFLYSRAFCAGIVCIVSKWCALLIKNWSYRPAVSGGQKSVCVFIWSTGTGTYYYGANVNFYFLDFSNLKKMTI